MTGPFHAIGMLRPGLRTVGFGRAAQQAWTRLPADARRQIDAYVAGVNAFLADRHGSALPPELSAQARGGQNADPNDPVFATFGDNYLKIRLRSHRDVAAAHYADLS